MQQQIKILESLEKCKAHGGPLTPGDISKLDELTDEQIILEAKYLKKTVASNIRLKHKEGKKMIDFSPEEIKQQIRDVFKLSLEKPQLDVDSLLQNIYVNDEVTALNSVWLALGGEVMGAEGKNNQLFTHCSC